MNDLGLLVAPSPTPARPGPGPIPERSVETLEMPVGRRIHGLLPGDDPAVAIGRGLEIDRVRPYVPGDDVRRIDWNVTARTGETHVREDVPERQLTTWILLDRSASMHFGTADRRKADVAAGAAAVLGRVATRRANRLGVITFGDGAEKVTIPRAARPGFLGVVTALRAPLREDGGGSTSPARALSLVAGTRSIRGLVVIVSDFRGPLDWLPQLADVAGRHQVLAIEVADPREDELVDVGELALVDPETGALLRVDTGDRHLRESFAAAAASERAALVRELRRLRVGHIRLTTSGAWLPTLVRHLGGKGRPA